MAKGKYSEWLEEDKLLLLQSWARSGLTDEQISHNIGIHIATLCEWKKRFPEINQALKKGKEVVDILVENALLKRALGHTIEEKHVKEITRDGITTKTVEKYTREVPGDVTAQIYWLKNRKPEEWRDKPRESETSAVMQAMCTQIAEMLKVADEPAPNRNIEDLE